MAKKFIALVLAAACVASVITAEEAKNAGPKVSAEFVQRMDAEFVDGYANAASTYGTDTIYSRSEIKGAAAFDLGNGLGLTASAKDRLELRLNPGNLESVDAGVEFLGKIRDRNRLYLNLDGTLALDKAFNIGLGAEYRLATDLRTDKEGNVVPEDRVTPTLSFNGKIDIFSYSLVSSVPLYLDNTPLNNANDFFPEFEGTYGAGLGIKIDDTTTFKIDLGEYLDVVFPKEALAATDKATVVSNLSAKFALSASGVTPMLGFIMNTAIDKTGLTTDNVVGGTCGLEFKKDNWTFNVGGDLGVNTADGRGSRLEKHLTAQIKIKA